MNIDQLKYLVDLAKTSSMNTTAKRMFISQQAISESMKRLEKELDCTLLTRSKTG
ncbi:MAG: LysR family transcriptional regulator, partial [Peptococcaceae bacterium]|nr:LysR family transcriptional regulator [Peptococcaceae bacterium]